MTMLKLQKMKLVVSHYLSFKSVSDRISGKGFDSYYVTVHS